MKKIIIAVLTFVLLNSVIKTNAQCFKHYNCGRPYRGRIHKCYTEHNRFCYRNIERNIYGRNFERGRIYYNQPRIVYHQSPTVQFASYNQARRQGYYYYPNVNVYFSPFTHLYIYQFNGGWVSGEVLPHGITINEPYTQVYCNVGENIWLYNRAHTEEFRKPDAVVERQFGRPNVARPMLERRVGTGPRGRR